MCEKRERALLGTAPYGGSMQPVRGRRHSTTDSMLPAMCNRSLSYNFQNVFSYKMCSLQNLFSDCKRALSASEYTWFKIPILDDEKCCVEDSISDDTFDIREHILYKSTHSIHDERCCVEDAHAS